VSALTVEGTTDQEAAMKLTLLGSESKSGQSPTLYATDRVTLVVQGWRITDAEALGAMAVPEHETAVEIPIALLRFARRADLEC
jgi:hypothetical protein